MAAKVEVEAAPAEKNHQGSFEWVHLITLCDQFLVITLKEVQDHLQARDAEQWERYHQTLTEPPPAVPEGQEKPQDREKETGAFLLAIEQQEEDLMRSSRRQQPGRWNAGDMQHPNNNAFVADWWAVVRPAVELHLQRLGYLLREPSPGVFQLERGRPQAEESEAGTAAGAGAGAEGGQVLTFEEIEALRRRGEAELRQPGLFDYQQVVTTLIAAIVKKVAQVGEDILSDKLKEHLPHIYCRPTVAIGEEWSIPYDIAFEGGGDHGKQIAYPDANTFNEVLIGYWEQLARLKGRVYLDFLARCIKACSHEVVHCLQREQVDNNPLSWSAEHDASFLAGSLMVVLADDPSLLRLLGPGWWQWLLLDWSMECFHQFHAFQGYATQQYLRWRDSFGLSPPNEDFADVRPGAFYFLKNFISFEALAYQPHVLKDQLAACFKDRVGDVYAAPVFGREKVLITTPFLQRLQIGFPK